MDTLRKKLGKRTYGFTLLELLVVMIIIGLLASVSVPLYRQITLRAAKGEAENTIGAIMTAQWLYFQENGTFIADETKLMVTWEETNFDIVTPFTSTDFALDVTITANGQAGRPADGETIVGKLTNLGKRTIN